jgi:hypothetical protein
VAGLRDELEEPENESVLSAFNNLEDELEDRRRRTGVVAMVNEHQPIDCENGESDR